MDFFSPSSQERSGAGGDAGALSLPHHQPLPETPRAGAAGKRVVRERRRRHQALRQVSPIETHPAMSAASRGHERTLWTLSRLEYLSTQ